MNSWFGGYLVGMNRRDAILHAVCDAFQVFTCAHTSAIRIGGR